MVSVRVNVILDLQLMELWTENAKSVMRAVLAVMIMVKLEIQINVQIVHHSFHLD